MGNGFRTALCAVAAAFIGMISVAKAGTNGPAAAAATVEIKAHQGAWLEEIDGGPCEHRSGLVDAGNNAMVTPGRHTFEVRTEQRNDVIDLGLGGNEGPSYKFDFEVKPGHKYEFMSAGLFTWRLEIYDKTTRELVYYDWGSNKLIADGSPDKAIKDYVTPVLGIEGGARLQGKDGVQIVTVDGAHVPGTAVVSGSGSSANEVLLTAGVHRVVLQRIIMNMTSTHRGENPLEHRFEAGHVYEVSMKGLIDRTANVEITPGTAANAAVPTMPPAGGSGLPLLQAKPDADDEDVRPVQAMKIVQASARSVKRDKQLQVEVKALVQLDAVENLNFTLRGTLLGADGTGMQGSAGSVTGTAIIHTGDASDTDTYKVYVPCGAAGNGWRGGKVRVELVDPNGGLRSTMVVDRIEVKD